MKTFFFASILTCLALNARAQFNQPDSVPPAQGWVQLTSNVTSALDCISLVGQDTVYAAGGVLLRSTDGGASWQQDMNAPRLGGYGYLHFFDANDAILCGTSDAIYTTSNDGVTWDTSHTGLLTCGVGIAGSSGLAAFGSPKNGCIMCASSINYTSNSGQTWHPSSGNAGGDYNCMIFADSEHACPMGTSTYWNNGNMPWAPTFERSSDGGATWQPVYLGPTQDAQGHIRELQGIFGE